MDRGNADLGCRGGAAQVATGLAAAAGAARAVDDVDGLLAQLS